MKELKQYDIMLTDMKHPELVEENTISYETDISPLTSPEEIVDFMNRGFQLNRRAEEYVYMLTFSSALIPLGIFQISRGTVNASFFSPREMLMRALLTGAANICVIHNHPSGSTVPSRADITSTKQLCEAGRIMGIELIDHIIIGDSFYSFREHGDL